MYNLMLLKIYIFITHNRFKTEKYLLFSERAFNFSVGISLSYFLFTIFANFPFKPLFLLILISIVFFIANMFLSFLDDIILYLEKTIKKKTFRIRLLDIFNKHEKINFPDYFFQIKSFSGIEIIKIIKIFDT